MSGVAYLERESFGLPLVALWLQTTTTSRNFAARCVLYRIEALLQEPDFDDHGTDGYHSS